MPRSLGNKSNKINGMVVSMGPEAWHRRHAIQVVAQLPEGTQDALAVLALARELVEGFLGAGQARAPVSDAASVIAFPASTSSR